MLFKIIAHPDYIEIQVGQKNIEVGCAFKELIMDAFELAEEGKKDVVFEMEVEDCRNKELIWFGDGNQREILT